MVTGSTEKSRENKQKKTKGKKKLMGTKKTQ